MKTHHPHPMIMALFSGLLSAAAVAQQGSNIENRADPGTDIEEVIVTGESLTSSVIGSETSFSVLGERSILDTPFSVSSFTEDLIRTTAAVSLKDLLIRDPSVTADVNAAGYQDRISIRGFNVGREAVMYDGLPGLAKGDGFFALGNLQNVEVFRGANAIVSGAAANGGVGGSINLVPKRPEDEPITNITVGYQAEGPLYAADVSRRFGANRQFGVRANFSRFEAEGPVEQFDRTNGIASLYMDWRATDTLYLAAEISRNDDRTNGYRDQLFLADGVDIPRVPDLEQNYQQPWSYIDSSTTQVFVKGRWEFLEGWSVTASAGRLESNYDGDNTYLSALVTVVDNDGTTVSSPYQWGFGDNEETGEAAQILVNGSLATGGLDHKFTFGYSYNDSEVDGDGGGFDGQIVSNLYNPTYIARPMIEENPNDAFSGGPSTSSFVGIYELQALEGRLSFLGGGRDVSIESTFGDDSIDQDEFSPFAALSFKPTANSSVYASYTESLEPGGSAPIGTENFPEQLSAGVSEQVELGAKLALGELLLTAAVFELERPLEIINADNRYVQDGRQRHRGLEMQAQGRIGENLNLITGFTLLDAEIDNGDPAVSGNVPVGVAEFSATLFLDYRLPFFPAGAVNAGLVYEDDQYFDLTNTRQVDSWWRLDVGGNYDFQLESTELTARFAVSNVTDEDYWTVADFSGLSLSAPRTYSVTLSAAF